MTEAGSNKRASIRLVSGESALAALDPGGVELLDADLDGFRSAITRESHTLKCALTDPHLFSGLGNAYSDEILHAARLPDERPPAGRPRALAPAQRELVNLTNDVIVIHQYDNERLQMPSGAHFSGM